MAEPAPELALAAICRDLVRLGHRFALVGGLAVSVRAEVRFTRDVDIVVLVADDSEAELLTCELRSAGYSAVAACWAAVTVRRPSNRSRFASGLTRSF